MAWSGNIRLMYEGIKQATGKPTKRSASLKFKTRDVIKDRDKQMSRWVITFTSTPEQTLSPKRRLTALKTCLFLKRAGLRAHSAGAQQSHRRPGEWKSSWWGRHSPRSYQMRQTCTTGATSRSPVSVLERRQGALGHAQCQDNYPVQK